jgi:microsomal dipeptidase-like Zn-dependent dipeptidase
VGIDHVALGSNFDGGIQTSFDCSGIIILTEALIREGFSDEEIKLIMGENQLRFLKHNFPL